MAGTPSVVAVFFAGVVTILTPCCLPMLPPMLAGSVGHRFRPLSIVFGSISSFTALGVATGFFGGLSPDALRGPLMAVMIAFGAVMADDDIHEVYSTYASKVAGRATEAVALVDERDRPLASAFLLGLLLGVVWLPCVGPILGGVLAYVGTTGDVSRSASLLFVYGLGFSVPLLGVAYGSKRGGRALADTVMRGWRPVQFRKVAGYVLVVTGVAMLFDIDKLVLSLLA
ncbi:cytochrome C biogenesis protein CcdA [Haladaptatus sp. W1]|uniref:cytochrome c biogenesis CcdA family protein n=1 Tax=Haladaptatus sp. W1 TaxID=1897478 RepID=UPI0008497D81|nr:cytochrome c biogenesis protein CcdA [Haladaptatus sp. W1]ODR83203.1 cytochrome C biogenesis protein CcdA [Haladaptatus sp. W1]